MTALLLASILGCGGASAPEAPKPAPEAMWLTGVKTWYCGTERTDPPKGAPAPTVPPTRDVVVKLATTSGGLTGLYALNDNGRSYIGTFTRSVLAGERMATVRSENSERQKGEAKLTLSPDYQTLTIEWHVGEWAAAGTTTLTSAAGPTACAAGKLLR